MFYIQNLKEFIENPMGKGNTSIPGRQLIKDDLDKRYNKLITDKKIEVKVYKKGDEYYFHFLIPSESERNNTYDVVLYFTMGRENFKFDNFINRYFIKFFSNSPSFTFTYAYAVNKNEILVEELQSKYGDEILKKTPSMRNPAEIFSYEKSVYFACLFLLKNTDYQNKMYLNSIAKPFNENGFVNSIRGIQTIDNEIKKENKRLKKEKEEKELKNKKEKSSKDDNKLKPKVPSARKNNIMTVKPKHKITSRKSSINKIKPK